MKDSSAKHAIKPSIAPEAVGWVLPLILCIVFLVVDINHDVVEEVVSGRADIALSLSFWTLSVAVRVHLYWRRGITHVVSVISAVATAALATYQFIDFQNLGIFGFGWALLGALISIVAGGLRRLEAHPAPN